VKYTTNITADFVSLELSRGKGKCLAVTCYGRHRGEVEVQLHSLANSAPDRGGWWTPHPSRFTPGKGNRYLLYRRLLELQGRSGWVCRTENLLSPPPSGL